MGLNAEFEIKYKAVNGKIVKVMQINVCWSRRTTKDCDYEARKFDFFKLIKEVNPDVILFNEIYMDWVPEFKETFSDYHPFFYKQNARGGVCSNAIFIANDFATGTCEENQEPTFKMHTFDFSQFSKQAETSITVLLNDKFLFVCTHFCMDREGRMVMAANIAQSFPPSIFNPEKHVLVLGGDFNCFIDDGRKEQLGIVEENLPVGTVSASALAVCNSDPKKPCVRSFYPYAYDNCIPESALKLMKECDLLGIDYKLDQIYYYSPNKSKSKILFCVVIDNAYIGGIDAKNSSIETPPLKVSDHDATVLAFEL